MKSDFLGDSYDLVKRFFIHSLASFGAWAVHPMLTEDQERFGEQQIAVYQSLLGGIRIVSHQVLHADTNREDYFAPCMKHDGPLLLDPNIGFKLRSSRSVDHLHQPDIVPIVNDRLVLIFDQSRSRYLQRDGIEAALRAKLEGLAAAGLCAMVYRSHACFLFVSKDFQEIARVRGILTQAGLPERRLIEAPQP